MHLLRRGGAIAVELDAGRWKRYPELCVAPVDVHRRPSVGDLIALPGGPLYRVLEVHPGARTGTWVLCGYQIRCDVHGATLRPGRIAARLLPGDGAAPGSPDGAPGGPRGPGPQ